MADSSNRDALLTVSFKEEYAYNVQLRWRRSMWIPYDNPTVIERGWAVTDNMTMGELMELMKIAASFLFRVPSRALLTQVTYIGTDLDGFDLVTILDKSDERSLNRTIKDAIPRTGSRDDNLISIELFYTWVIGKENQIPFNRDRGSPPSNDKIGCNFCGKVKHKMQKEKSGQFRIFCHKECQNLFYAGSFSVNIEEATLHNTDYRRVLHTTKNQQLVVMSIMPIEREIGGEIHPNTTQFIRIESGTGCAEVDGVSTLLEDGVVIMINPGAKHNIVNLHPTKPLKLYTVYSPPEHAPGLIEKRKGEVSIQSALIGGDSASVPQTGQDDARFEDRDASDIARIRAGFARIIEDALFSLKPKMGDWYDVEFFRPGIGDAPGQYLVLKSTRGYNSGLRYSLLYREEFELVDALRPVNPRTEEANRWLSLSANHNDEEDAGTSLINIRGNYPRFQAFRDDLRKFILYLLNNGYRYTFG